MSNKTETATFKVDPDVKKEAQELFDQLGLSMGAAINLFLTQSIREKAIPFRIELKE